LPSSGKEAQKKTQEDGDEKGERPLSSKDAKGAEDETARPKKVIRGWAEKRQWAAGKNSLNSDGYRRDSQYEMPQIVAKKEALILAREFNWDI